MDNVFMKYLRQRYITESGYLTFKKNFTPNNKH